MTSPISPRRILLDDFHVGRRVTELEPQDGAQRARDLAAEVEDPAAAVDVDGGRLLAVGVFARRDRGFQDLRVGVGRRRNQDRIDLRVVQQPEIGFRPSVDRGRLDVRPAPARVQSVDGFRARVSRSSRRSARATIRVFVWAAMAVRTAVPRPPQPMIPTRTAELAAVPKTVDGWRMDNAEKAAASFRKVRRSIFSLSVGKRHLLYCDAGLKIILGAVSAYRWRMIDQGIGVGQTGGRAGRGD